ncbi:hypothetical protein H6504_01285 [Candidatus Woesearchaeota archaeon]|nr:hypothetical protein [Candidatus Woesearchaeota archaeon]
MVIKTFNVDEEVYRKFSAYCKDLGLSMSKQVDMFMRTQVEDEPKVRQEFLDRLETIRKGKFVKIKGSLADRYVRD